MNQRGQQKRIIQTNLEDGSPFLEGYWKENHFYGTYYDEDGAHTLPAA